MVVVKFLVFVSEVVSIFSKILTWIIGGAKGYLCPTNSIIGGHVSRLPPKSTHMLSLNYNCNEICISWTSMLRPSHLQIPGEPKIAHAAIRRRAKDGP